MESESTVYTLDDLFRVTTVYEGQVRGRACKVYLRTLGQVDHDARQNHASAEARKVLRALKDETSDAYQTYISELDQYSKDELLDMMVEAEKVLHLTAQAEREIHAVDEPEPANDATVSEILETEEQRAEIAERVKTARQEWLTRAAADYRAKIDALAPAALLAEAQELRRSQVIGSAYNKAWGDATLYGGVWRDKKHSQRYFASPAAAGACEPVLYDRLLSAYFKLDAFVANTEALKN